MVRVQPHMLPAGVRAVPVRCGGWTRAVGNGAAAYRPGAYAGVTMGDEHERFEELAVGHVLGGLEAADAARFRSHLIGCRACRSRVAELRSIAADLVAAERDELASTTVRTEVARREGDDPEPTSPPMRLTIRHVTLAVVVVAMLATAMAFWNLHLRTVAAGYLEVAEARGDTLRQLATGVAVPTETAEGIDATVVLDGEQVAFTLAGLPRLEDGDVLVAWLVDTHDGAEAVLFAPAGRVDGDAISGHANDGGASRLIISIERGSPGEQPTGVELLSATLRRSLEQEIDG